jgi:hypothetical protein
MQPVLERLHYDTPYRSGPDAWTDLHAGGLFSCVVFQEVLQFSRDGSVRRWYEILDDSRPLDDEVEALRRSASCGGYLVNERGYLECVFADLKLVGLPCEKAPDLLAFHAWDPNGGASSSRVYRREGSASPEAPA